MGVKKRQMKVYEVSYECDKCNNGEMHVVELGGGAKIYKGLKIQHACNNCGHKMYFQKEHPFIYYV